MEPALLNQLRGAVAAIDRNSPSDACAALQVLFRITFAQRGRQVSEASYTEWDGRVSQVRPPLACAAAWWLADFA